MGRESTSRFWTRLAEPILTEHRANPRSTDNPMDDLMHDGRRMLNVQVDNHPVQTKKELIQSYEIMNLPAVLTEEAQMSADGLKVHHSSHN